MQRSGAKASPQVGRGRWCGCMLWRQRQAPRSTRGLCQARQLGPTEKETRPTRSRVVYAQYYTRSPAFWHGVAACRIRELVGNEVPRFKLSPEVAASPSCHLSTQCSCCLAGRRVDQSDGHMCARPLDWEPQVGIVRNDQGCIDYAAEDVQEQVRSDVDIAALLFPVGDRNHEAGISNCLSCSVLDHYGPVRRDQLWSSLGVPYCQRRAFAAQLRRG